MSLLSRCILGHRTGMLWLLKVNLFQLAALCPLPILLLPRTRALLAKHHLWDVPPGDGRGLSSNQGAAQTLGHQPLLRIIIWTELRSPREWNQSTKNIMWQDSTKTLISAILWVILHDMISKTIPQIQLSSLSIQSDTSILRGGGVGQGFGAAAVGCLRSLQLFGWNIWDQSASFGGQTAVHGPGQGHWKQIDMSMEVI